VTSLHDIMNRLNRFSQSWRTLQQSLPLLWLARHPLFALGLMSLPLYLAVLIHGDFRPSRMESFFPIFLGLFAFYGAACWLVIKRRAGGSLSTIFLFAIGFNALLIPSWPTLSDDMFRYIWDGRVQAAGINPYRYASNAAELTYLRDDLIWSNINRPRAVTIYPPGAQIVFAATWRVFPDSVVGMKLVMVAATLLAGWLLVKLLRALNQPPERVLIFLWNPLLMFEVAHAAHADALYLPLIVGAFLLRAHSPSDRVSWRHEAGIGILLGLATLIKLYPAMLVIPLWSLRDESGKRRWRLALPIATVLTVLIGYAFYIQPGVNALGFLPTYGREFFNVSPLMHWLTDLAMAHRIQWYTPGNIGMPFLVAIISLWMVISPAREGRQTILRCFWPIGIYLLINHNLFSWYALWLLPLIALDLFVSRHSRFNMALAWWVFTGTVALSYTFFIRWREEQWAVQLQFWPLYILLVAAAITRIRQWLSTPQFSIPLDDELHSEHEPSTLKL